MPHPIMFDDADPWLGRLREAFRMFIADRIASVEATPASFRPRRAALLRDYLAELSAGRRTSQTA